MFWKILALSMFALSLSACQSPPSNQVSVAGEGGARTAQQQTAMADDNVDESSDGPTPGTQQHLEVTVGDRVFFDFDEHRLKGEARSTVENLAAWLKQHSDTDLTIGGHADERGTREYNIALGARRANAVRDYLVSLGVAPSRLETVSFGEERPAVRGSNEKAWSQNRRAVFRVERPAQS